MKNKIRFLFIPLLIISLSVSVTYLAFFIFDCDNLSINEWWGICLYPFINFILVFESIWLKLTDLSVSFPTLFCLSLLILTVAVYVYLIYKSIKRSDSARKNASGVIIVLTCIELLPSCACSLTSIPALILSLTLRALIIYSCAINIKAINDY